MRARRRQSLVISLALLVLALGCLGRGLWIESKALLAQVLLERAWLAARQGVEQPRPWPSADTWPVARLLAPDHDQSLIVLSGASGRVLAFGPGHLDGSAAVEGAGNTVIAGHRDTHFAFLRRLTVGDRLDLEARDGRVRRFEVSWSRVVDQTDLSVVEATEGDVLTLVTCFPFDATVPGGPLRYVVRAGRVEP